jgi:V/A-type H+/Na+-transporting ATPase subunit I
MIVPMLKYSFLVYHKDYKKFLMDLRRLGAVHIIEKEKEVTTEIRDKYEHIKDVEGVLRFLAKRDLPKSTADCTLSGAEAFDIVKNAVTDAELKQQQLNALNKEIALVEPWGDFSVETITKLRDNRIKLRFYTVSAKKFNQNWLQEYPIEVIGHHAGQVYFVMVEKGYLTDEIPEAEEMRAPEKPLSHLLTERKELEKQLKELKDLFDFHAKTSTAAIGKYHRQMQESAAFDNALMHTVHHADEKVMLLEGWVPELRKEDVVKYLDEHNILFTEQQPAEDEKVPIKLVNNRFSRLFEPIGEFYELPNHRELDLVPFFAPFYMMFFGFSLGDAGYGLLIILAAAFAKKKLPEYKSILSLAQFLGLATVIFGMLTGTIFGINLIESEIPWLEQYKRFMLEPSQLFNLALILGVIQIIFGMVVKVMNVTRVMGFRYALSTVGWLILLVGGGAL